MISCLETAFHEETSRFCLCHCGCGLELQPKASWNSNGVPMYINGHTNKGKTKENSSSVASMAAKNSGEHHHMKRPEIAAKVGAKKRGVPRTDMRGENNPMKKPEIRDKVSQARRGWTKGNHPGVARMAAAISGERHPLYGKHPSEETRKKRSLSLIGRNKGEKGSMWCGGNAYEPYGPGDTEDFKELIRKRDSYTCQECGRAQAEGEKRFVAHHIDHDKKNHAWWNRITLCNSCHSKTIDPRKRACWQERFHNLLLERFDEVLLLL